MQHPSKVTSDWHLQVARNFPFENVISIVKLQYKLDVIVLKSFHRVEVLLKASDVWDKIWDSITRFLSFKVAPVSFGVSLGFKILECGVWKSNNYYTNIRKPNWMDLHLSSELQYYSLKFFKKLICSWVCWIIELSRNSSLALSPCCLLSTSYCLSLLSVSKGLPATHCKAVTHWVFLLERRRRRIAFCWQRQSGCPVTTWAPKVLMLLYLTTSFSSWELALYRQQYSLVTASKKKPWTQQWTSP